MNSSTRKKQGFTLLEIILVIAVIGILAAMLSPRFAGVLTTSQTNRTTSDKAVANRILEAFEGSGGTFTAGGGGQGVIDNTSATTVWADLRGGTKRASGITYTLPASFASTALPSGWTLSGNRFQ